MGKRISPKKRGGNVVRGLEVETEANLLFIVCWDLDINSQTMWPPTDHSARHPLPPPQIDPEIEWMLKFLRMAFPDLNWLRASCPSLSLPPVGSLDNHQENRATSSSGGEGIWPFPSSSNGLQNGAAALNSMTTPALVVPGAKKENAGVTWVSEKSDLTVAGVEPIAVSKTGWCISLENPSLSILNPTLTGKTPAM